MALKGELGERMREYEALALRVRELCEPLTQERFNWHPQPGVWSVAQCIEHLNRTNEVMLANIGRAISDGRVKQMFSDGPFIHGPFGALVIWLTEPPPKLRGKAPKLIAPAPTLDRDATLARYGKLHEQRMERLVDAAGLHLSKIRAQALDSKWITLTLADTFAMIGAHDRRHVWQAERTLHPAD